jgi:hypothetical protein
MIPHARRRVCAFLYACVGASSAVNIHDPTSSTTLTEEVADGAQGGAGKRASCVHGAGGPIRDGTRAVAEGLRPCSH